VPLVVFAAAIGSLRPPASGTAAMAFLVAVAAAMVLSAALTLLLSLGSFWTVGGDGLAMVAPVVIWSLSGITLPLPLFPDWIQPLFAVLPFRGLLDTPVRLYTGDLPADACWLAIAHQLAWAALLMVVARAAIDRGLRRLATAGG
jgi:ABC-2 type transport system permease protein